MACQVGRMLSRHLKPLCAAAKNLQHTVELRTSVMPRPTKVVRSPTRAKDTLQQLSPLICQLRTACHLSPRKLPEQTQFRRFVTPNCL